MKGKELAKIVDPGEFEFVVNLASEVASGKNVRSIKRTTDFKVNIIYDKKQTVDTFTFPDNPLNRGMMAIKQYCQTDGDKFNAMMLRLFALGGIINSDDFKKWIKKHNEGIDIHDDVFEVAAKMPLNSRLNFTKRDFKKRLNALSGKE